MIYSSQKWNRFGSSECLGTAGEPNQLYMTESQDCEDPREYRYGGYHPVQIGDSLNRRYQVVSKLGWGFFSTVWLCMDLRSGQRVAVKVLKSGPGFAQAGQDEQAILRYVSSASSLFFPAVLLAITPPAKGSFSCLMNSSWLGSTGSTCAWFWSCGPSLRTWQLCFGNPGLMQPLVKQILTRVLQGLDYLHTRCKIIHTDMKPENILLHLKENSHITPAGGSSSVSLPAVEGNKTTETEEVNLYKLKKISVKIADLGSSCWVYKHFSEEIQTRL
uniref:non-specific serine/threonine protein kinase n=1 Tax=Poecilia reticulata TaxID=8081 RepID=A0A3P9N063_POERE